MPMIQKSWSFVKIMSPTKSSLQLDNVVLKNYKTYRNTTTFALSRDSEKTITIIHGAMGRGKTTLLGAIHWCLYGANNSENNRNSDQSIINDDTLAQLKIGDHDETSVELFLYEGDEPCYKITRVIEYSKHAESEELVQHPSIGGNIPSGIHLVETVNFSRKSRDKNDWDVYTDPSRVQEYIENLFPSSLSSYFLFDAELLDKFFDVSDKKNVKDGIEKISGLPIVYDAIKHLNKTSKEIMKDVKGIDIDSIKNEVFHLEKSMEASNKKIAYEDGQLNKFREEKKSLEIFLRDHNEKMISETQLEVNSLNTTLQEIRKNLKNHDKKMGEWLLYCNTIIRLNESMKISMKKCNKWEQDGKIPIAVSGSALKNILSSIPSICICGTHLDEGSKERSHMEKLLDKNMVESPVIQSISTGRGHWENMTTETEYSQITKMLNQFRSERNDLNSFYNDRNKKLKELRKKLDEHNHEEIRKKSQRINELERDITTSIGIRAVAKDKLGKDSRLYENKNQELTNTMAQHDKYTSQTNQRKLADTLEKILSKCKDNLINELRSIVAKKTTEYFQRLVSSNNFSRIEIKSDYDTIALGNDDKSKELSVGQRCCLALSYAAAIREIAGKNHFMIIDAPLVAISQKERVEIAKNLPKFIPKTQITLLVQDQEYTGRANEDIVGKEIPSFRETLIGNGSLWREYVLELDEKPNDLSSHTVVKEIKHD